MTSDRGRPSGASAGRAVALLAIAGVVAAAMSVAPATGASKPLTKKKGDQRYINVGEKASNAELLDGRDSTSFIDANAFETQNATYDPMGFALDSNVQQVIDLEGLNDQAGDNRITTAESNWIMGTATVTFVATGASRVGCTLFGTGPGGDAPMGSAVVEDIAGSSLGEVVSVTGAIIQPAGTYDVNLRCNEATGDITFDSGTLTVWTMPVGTD